MFIAVVTRSHSRVITFENPFGANEPTRHPIAYRLASVSQESSPCLNLVVQLWWNKIVYKENFGACKQDIC